MLVTLGGPFKRALDRQGPGLEAIESLSDLCKTSLTATAIRYADLTDDAVAIVISTGPAIDFMSETIKSLPQLTWLRKGAAVPRGIGTAQLNANARARRVAEGERAEAEVDVMDWLGRSRSIRATEQVVGLWSYGKTLTVLTCPSVQDETYQEEDEEDLAERWTRRFVDDLNAAAG